MLGCILGREGGDLDNGDDDDLFDEDDNKDPNGVDGKVNGNLIF